MPPRAELLKIRSAVVQTSQGDFLMELFPDIAPVHVANFKFLADKGFYNGLSFHLVQNDYIVQGGDPSGSGNGGPTYSLLPEFSEKHHVRGSVGMARRADDINPQRLSNGSQFHILLREARHMDKKYTIFGEVIDGLEVIEKLRPGDKIKSIRVFVRKDAR
jgi:peptidyl-prolyl cis-trans isomerase B (cyclophilin B)